MKLDKHDDVVPTTVKIIGYVVKLIGKHSRQLGGILTNINN